MRGFSDRVGLTETRRTGSKNGVRSVRSTRLSTSACHHRMVPVGNGLSYLRFTVRYHDRMVKSEADLILEEHPEYSPFRVPPQQRSDLLDWFLSADLQSSEPLITLGVLTGRFGMSAAEMEYSGPWRRVVDQVWRRFAKGQSPRDRSEKFWWRVARGEAVATRDSRLGPSLERGDVEVRPIHFPGRKTYFDGWPAPVSVRTFLTYYQGVQRRFNQIRRQWAADLGGPAHSLLALIDLDHYLSDVRVTLGKDRYDLIDRPFRVDHRSSSLVGELALALLHELTDARSSGICVVCKRVWLSTSPRVRQRTCLSSDCQREHRNRWKRAHPEDPKAVTARVRRFRQNCRTAAKR